MAKRREPRSRGGRGQSANDELQYIQAIPELERIAGSAHLREKVGNGAVECGGPFKAAQMPRA